MRITTIARPLLRSSLLFSSLARSPLHTSRIPSPAATQPYRLATLTLNVFLYYLGTGILGLLAVVSLYRLSSLLYIEQSPCTLSYLL